MDRIDSFWEVLAYIAIVGFITWILSRIIRWLLTKLILRTSRVTNRTGLLFMRSAVKLALAVLAASYIIYSVPALREKALFIISSASIFAAIIGFVAQSAISNLVSGVFIVLFKPFRVGDYIKLDDHRLGIVNDITLRHTVINNFENKRLIIPNALISKESILNYSIEDSSVYSFNNFILGMYADIDLARKIIEEEAAKLPDVIDKRSQEDINKGVSATQVRVINTKESVLHLRAYIWIDNPKKEFINKCILREAVHKRFIKEGVNLPIPLRKIIQ